MYYLFFSLLGIIFITTALTVQLLTVAHVWLYTALGIAALLGLKSASWVSLVIFAILFIWWGVSFEAYKTLTSVDFALEYVLCVYV